MSTTPKPVSAPQAYGLARAYMLGAKTPEKPEGGFASFVPGWTPAPEGKAPGDHAAHLLNAAGADHASAKAALDYVINSRPVTDVGRAYRGAKGLALLLRQPVPAMPVGLSEQPKLVQAPKLEMGQLAQAELDLALAQVRLAEAKLRALRAR